MALIDNDYFTLQMVTLGLKTAFTPNADVLEILISEASEWVEAYCRRQFGAQTLTETHWGKGGRRLILNEYPIDTVTSITAVSNTGAVADTYAVSDIRILSSGMLELIDAANPWYRDRLYTVVYTTPDPVPGPVKRATACKVVEMLDPQYFPGKTKSVELITSVQEQMVQLLEDFRRERLG